jgi:hypothetical protein
MGHWLAGWLAPVPLDPPRKKVREKSSSRRASNKGCLAMSLDQYLKLLDWTGRQLRPFLEEYFEAIDGTCREKLRFEDQSSRSSLENHGGRLNNA